MLEINPQTSGIINNFIKNKEHLKLTIGFISGEESAIKTYNSLGEINTVQPYIYEIGSITKTFTTSLLAKYVFEGKVSLDNSFSEYVKGLPAGTYYPNLRRLATHTAGYSPFLPLNLFSYLKLSVGALISGGLKTNPLSGAVDIDKLTTLLNTKKIKDKDYSYMYSNFGISIIGYVLGNISGNGYWDTMNDFLTHELELKNTYLGINSSKNIHGYDKKNNDYGNWIWTDRDFLSPAGGCSSTAEDLLKYAKLNMYDEKQYLFLCHQKHANGTKKYDMGLGWELQKDSSVISIDGGTGSFTSFLGFDKVKKSAVAILSNYSFREISHVGYSMLNYMVKNIEINCKSDGQKGQKYA